MIFFTSATTFIVLSLCLAIFVYFFKNRDFYRLASQFPGATSLPIIGHAYLFLGDSEQIYNAIFDLYDKFPEVLKIWLAHRLIIAFYKPEEIKTVLQSPITIEKDGLYSLMEPWLGSGLITAKGDKWKVHRKLIQPAFNQRILLSFMEVFHKHSELLVKNLKKEVDGEEFNINRYISKSSLGIIYESAMGIDSLNDEEAGNKYLKALERTLEIMRIRIFKFWLQLDVVFKFTKLYKESQEYLNYLHNSTDKIIRTKRSKIVSGSQEDGSSKQVKPFLELLMKLSDEEDRLSDLELRNEVDTFLFAGHDTTATVVSFTLLMLASHPDIQDKVYKEIYELFGSKSPEEVPFKSEHLQHFVYLERVIKETMRFFPIAPILLRKVTENLKLGEYIVPKDATILIPISKIHLLEKLWPDPYKFNPDRFLPEEVAKRHPFSYLPFSGGPRNCIGQAYAMMSMKSMISTILRKYIVKKDEIKPIKDIRLKLDTLLRAVEPITIRIEERIKL